MIIFDIDLQLFGEGGDGGESAGEGSGGTSGVVINDDEMSRIPERARERFKKAKESTTKPVQPESTQAPEEADASASEMTYADLIKSDKYKAEHEAYMSKTISDRLKKYKGVEEDNARMRDTLSIVANKYGLDPNSEDFLEALQGRVDSDASYFEDYAMEHNISTEEARELLTLRQKVAKQEAQAKMTAQAEAQNQALMALRESADRTKMVYPEFDLATEMQDERFRTLCAATHGDTLAAYRAIHHDELMARQGKQIAQQATSQIANVVASNKARPIENGMSSQATSVVSVDWSKASLSELRAQAEAWRRGNK